MAQESTKTIPPFKTVAATTIDLNATTLPETEMTQETTADDTPVTEKVKEQAKELSDQASALKDQAVDQASALKDQAVEGYHKLEENAEVIKQRAEELNNRAVEFIQNNPAVTIVGAFGIGYLLGSLAARRWII